MSKLKPQPGVSKLRPWHSWDLNPVGLVHCKDQGLLIFLALSSTSVCDSVNFSNKHLSNIFSLYPFTNKALGPYHWYSGKMPRNCFVLPCFLLVGFCYIFMVYQLLTIGFSSFFFFKQGPSLLFPQLIVRPGTMSSSSLSLPHMGDTRQMEKERREERQEKGRQDWPLESSHTSDITVHKSSRYLNYSPCS